MKLRMRNVYLLDSKLLPASEKENLGIRFYRPENIGEGMYGWTVHVESGCNNEASTHQLYLESVSQFQFHSKRDMKKHFRRKEYFESFAHLVYAAHCHHAALFIASASTHAPFEGHLPLFISWDSAKEYTFSAMKCI
jgi:flavin-dependent dehydrogenase